MKNLIYNHLNDKKVHFETLIEEDLRTAYRFGIKLKNGINDVFIVIKEDPNHIIFNTYSPINIPIEYHAKVSEFITRVNVLLNIGCFNLDFSNGDLYFKTSYMFENDYTAHTKIFDTNLHFTYYSMDTYMPGILSIIYGNKDPLDAFNKIENIIKPELN